MVLKKIEREIFLSIQQMCVCVNVVILQGHHVNLFRATSLLILEIAAIEVEISDIEYYVVTDASIR